MLMYRNQLDLQLAATDHALESRVLLEGATMAFPPPADSTAVDSTTVDSTTTEEQEGFQIQLNFKDHFSKRLQKAIQGAASIWELLIAEHPRGKKKIKLNVREKTSGNPDSPGDGNSTTIRFRPWLTDLAGMVVIATHEIGHALGLHHVDGYDDIMQNNALNYSTKLYKITNKSLKQLENKGYTINKQYKDKTLFSLIKKVAEKRQDEERDESADLSEENEQDLVDQITADDSSTGESPVEESPTTENSVEEDPEDEVFAE